MLKSVFLLFVEVAGHESPHEPGEFSGYAYDRNVGVLAGCESLEPVVEAYLGSPRIRDDLGGLTFLAATKLVADGGAMPVRPGGLDEEPAHMGVAGPCDRPPPGAFSGRMLAGDQTGESQKRAGSAKPAEVTHFDT